MQIIGGFQPRSPPPASATYVIEEEITSLSDIESKGVYDRVSVRVKVSKVTGPTEVPTGKKKQDVVVVHGSGSGK